MSARRAALACAGLLAGCGLFGGDAATAPAPEAEPAVAEAPDERTTLELVRRDGTPKDVPAGVTAAEATVIVEGATFVDLKPDGSGLDAQLVAQAAAAKAAGEAPFVQLYGDWCGPCRELRASLTDPLMQDAFAGTRIVMIDTFAWRNEDGNPFGDGGFKVPAFLQLEDDGSFGPGITGDAWGENIPTNMAPPLRSYFRSYGAKPPGE